MIILAALLIGLSAYLFVPGTDGRRALRRLATDQTPTLRRRSWRWPAIVGPGCLAALITAGILDGIRGAIYAAAGAIVVALMLRLISSGRRRRQAIRAEAEIADACRALAAEVRIGKVPTEALTAAATDHPVLAEAGRIDRLGGDVVLHWHSQAEQPGQAGLRELARGWSLCRSTGSPLSTALDQIADKLMSDQSIRMMVAGELAAPRASGKIMAVLPLLGIGLGYLIGGDPVDFLWHEPAGWLCLLVGSALAATGILWIDGLSRQAENG